MSDSDTELGGIKNVFVKEIYDKVCGRCKEFHRIICAACDKNPKSISVSGVYSRAENMIHKMETLRLRKDTALYKKFCNKEFRLSNVVKKPKQQPIETAELEESQTGVKRSNSESDYVGPLPVKRSARIKAGNITHFQITKKKKKLPRKKSSCRPCVQKFPSQTLHKTAEQDSSSSGFRQAEKYFSLLSLRSNEMPHKDVDLPQLKTNWTSLEVTSINSGVSETSSNATPCMLFENMVNKPSVTDATGPMFENFGQNTPVDNDMPTSLLKQGTFDNVTARSFQVVTGGKISRVNEKTTPDTYKTSSKAFKQHEHFDSTQEAETKRLVSKELKTIPVTELSENPSVDMLENVIVEVLNRANPNRGKEMIVPELEITPLFKVKEREKSPEKTNKKTLKSVEKSKSLDVKMQKFGSSEKSVISGIQTPAVKIKTLKHTKTSAAKTKLNLEENNTVDGNANLNENKTPSKGLSISPGVKNIHVKELFDRVDVNAERFHICMCKLCGKDPNHYCPTSLYQTAERVIGEMERLYQFEDKTEYQKLSYAEFLFPQKSKRVRNVVPNQQVIGRPDEVSLETLTPVEGEVRRPPSLVVKPTANIATLNVSDPSVESSKTMGSMLDVFVESSRQPATLTHASVGQSNSVLSAVESQRHVDDKSNAETDVDIDTFSHSFDTTTSDAEMNVDTSYINNLNINVNCESNKLNLLNQDKYMYVSTGIKNIHVKELFDRVNGNVNKFHICMCKLCEKNPQSCNRTRLYLRAKKLLQEMKRLYRYQDKTEYRKLCNSEFLLPHNVTKVRKSVTHQQAVGRVDGLSLETLIPIAGEIRPVSQKVKTTPDMQLQEEPSAEVLEDIVQDVVNRAIPYKEKATETKFPKLEIIPSLNINNTEKKDRMKKKIFKPCKRSNSLVVKMPSIRSQGRLGSKSLAKTKTVRSIERSVAQPVATLNVSELFTPVATPSTSESFASVVLVDESVESTGESVSAIVASGEPSNFVEPSNVVHDISNAEIDTAGGTLSCAIEAGTTDSGEPSNFVEPSNVVHDISNAEIDTTGGTLLCAIEAGTADNELNMEENDINKENRNLNMGHRSKQEDNSVSSGIKNIHARELFDRVNGNLKRFHSCICKLCGKNPQCFSPSSLFWRAKKLIQEMKRLYKHKDKTKYIKLCNEEFLFPKKRDPGVIKQEKKMTPQQKQEELNNLIENSSVVKQLRYENEQLKKKLLKTADIFRKNQALKRKENTIYRLKTIISRYKKEKRQTENTFKRTTEKKVGVAKGTYCNFGKRVMDKGTQCNTMRKVISELKAELEYAYSLQEEKDDKDDEKVGNFDKLQKLNIRLNSEKGNPYSPMVREVYKDMIRKHVPVAQIGHIVTKVLELVNVYVDEVPSMTVVYNWVREEKELAKVQKVSIASEHDYAFKKTTNDENDRELLTAVGSLNINESNESRSSSGSSEMDDPTTKGPSDSAVDDIHVRLSAVQDAMALGRRTENPDLISELSDFISELISQDELIVEDFLDDQPLELQLVDQPPGVHVVAEYQEIA